MQLNLSIDLAVKLKINFSMPYFLQKNMLGFENVDFKKNFINTFINK